MHALVEQVGETIECPDCFASNEVRAPAPAKQRVSAPAPVADTEEYHVRDDVDQPPPSTQILIPVVCRLCGTRMHAREDQIGQSVVCPDCETVNPVCVPRRSPKRKTPPLATVVPYQVGQAAPVTVPRKYVREMLDQAAEDAEQAARRQIKPPRYPFLSRIYTYPFHLRPAMMCLSLTIATMGVVAAISTVGQLPALLIPIVCGLVAVAAVATWTFASVFLTSVIESTANCQDNIEQWPEFGVVDWMIQGLYFVNCLTVSLLPLLVLAGLLPDHGAIAYGGGLVLAMLLFPLALLSMLEENSCLMPYCALVWRSWRRSWRAWLLFHLHSVALLAVMGTVGWFGFLAPNPWTMLLFVAVATVVMTIYFRLLGRLAYVIGCQSDQVPADQPVAVH
jgi:hypothetical protein